MSARERLIVYTLLALIAGWNVLVLAGRPRTAAYAAPAPRAADELGPADSLRLAGDDADLVLRNRAGRLSWGEEPGDRTYSLAFVHIGRILVQLIDADELVEERQALLEELQESEEDFQERLDAIRRRVEELDPQGPEARESMEEGNRLLQEYRQWGAEAKARQGAQRADHFERVYRELVSAVNVVADRKSIDIVLRFIPPDLPFESSNPEMAMSTIRLRSALRFPDALDITPEVMEELALEED